MSDNEYSDDNEDKKFGLHKSIITIDPNFSINNIKSNTDKYATMHVNDLKEYVLDNLEWWSDTQVVGNAGVCEAFSSMRHIENYEEFYVGELVGKINDTFRFYNHENKTCLTTSDAVDLQIIYHILKTRLIKHSDDAELDTQLLADSNYSDKLKIDIVHSSDCIVLSFNLFNLVFFIYEKKIICFQTSGKIAINKHTLNIFRARSNKLTIFDCNGKFLFKIDGIERYISDIEFNDTCEYLIVVLVYGSIYRTIYFDNAGRRIEIEEENEDKN